ncbi:DUF4132 domain-containing protein [Amycolatopsis pigmentata]|uniref:DUF4132 domain-containing protein n=1 Tax=Amycolatopsis pigmentata TaxID=450801 RepID=A0ABW5FZL4_9PSEU
MAVERSFDIPVEYQDLVHARRGGPTVPRVERGTDAVLRARCAERESIVDFALANPRSAPERVSAVQDFRSGKPDAVGAAALVSLLPGQGECEAEIADGLVVEHGLVFAADAIAALGAVAVHAHWDKYAPGNQVNHELRVVEPHAPPFGRWQFRPWAYERPAKRVRALLAVASEAEYDEAERVLARRRDHDACRVIVSYLMPHRQDWVDEAIERLLANEAMAPYECLWAMLLHSLDSHEQLKKLLRAKPGISRNLRDPSTLWTLAERVGPALVPHAVAAFDRKPVKDLLRLLAVLDRPKAFELLLAGYTHEYHEAALELLNTDPADALRRLSAAAAAGKTGTAAQLLADLKLADPALAAHVLGPEAVARMPQAPPESLPAPLVTPPWRRKGKAARQAVITGLTPNVEPRMTWLPGEYEEYSGSAHRYHWQRYTDWERAAAAIRAGEHDTHAAVSLMVSGPDEITLSLLGEWRANWPYIYDDVVKLLAARYELAALPFLLRAIRTSLRSLVPLLGPFLHLDVARMMAHWVATSKSVRPDAVGWLARHGADAAALLVPDAVGKAGVRRRCAETALRAMNRNDVLTAARSYGEQVRSAVEAILEMDPLDVVPAKMPVPGSWADPRVLPQIPLTGKDFALPDESVAHVLTMLALWDGEEEHPGLEVVRQVCDRAGLARFVLTVFQRWLYAGMPSKDGWALAALGSLGDDDAVRELVPLITTWPGSGGNARAVAGLDVLARIGTDLALSRLHAISLRTKFKALKARAREKIGAVSVERGLSTEQLADRLVPDLGLDGQGDLTLDYGPRRFVVGVDEQLKPRITDADGKQLKTLPKPGEADDHELATASYKRFSGFKKDLRALAADQVNRLERAMVDQRGWTEDEFRTLLAGHPVLGRLVPRLLWLADGVPFRVNGDGRTVDVTDGERDLPPGAMVSLAHPALLGEQTAQWRDVFAARRIKQPFRQLDRPVFTAGATTVDQLVGKEVSPRGVLGLRTRGWEIDDDFYVAVVTRPSPTGWSAMVAFDPPFARGDIDSLETRRLEKITLADGLGPVMFSEILADLTALT